MPIWLFPAAQTYLSSETQRRLTPRRETCWVFLRVYNRCRALHNPRYRKVNTSRALYAVVWQANPPLRLSLTGTRENLPLSAEHSPLPICILCAFPVSRPGCCGLGFTSIF